MTTKPEDIIFYKKNGYAVFNEFFNDEFCNDIKIHLEKFIKNVLPQIPSNRVYYDDIHNKNSLKQIQKIFEYDPFFYDLIHKNEIYELAEQLLDEKPSVINLQYFNKVPLHSKPTPPHQDGYYFKIKPMKAITLWLALDDVNESNGGIQYYSGSHQKGLRNHFRSGVLGFSQSLPLDDSILMDSEKIRPCCQAGTLLAHDALMMHSADKNQSNLPRRSLGFIYYGSSVEISEKEASEYQKKLDDELIKKGLV